MTYVMRHSNNKLFLAKADPNRRRFAHEWKAGVGAKMHYRWTRNIDEAITYETDDDSYLDWIMVGEPPVDFVDVPERSK